MLTTGIVIFYGVWMTSTGRLPLAQAAGTLFLYTQYVRMIYQPLSQIAAQYTQMQLAFTGASRILEVLNEEDELDRTTVVDIDGIAGDVVLDNVSFAYDEGHNVLKNIDITVEKGAMVALVGHTGSGKTTVMNLLNRFYDVHDGMIRFDGRDIRDISLKSLRKNVGIVLQDSILFTGTIRDNIAYGRRDANQEEVEDAAKRAHIHDFVMSLEDGYDTEVSEGNAKMSVGQKQLISIARTMLVNPDLLILDEATSNVDTVTEHQIQGAMDEITKGPLPYYDIQKFFSIAFEDRKIRRSLEFAVDYLNIEKDIPFHRAFSDAYYTGKVFAKIFSKEVEKYVSYDVFMTPRTKRDEVHKTFPTYSKYISREFKDKTTAMADKSVNGTRCYLCGRRTKKKTKWFSVNGKHYYSLSYCKRHGYLKGKVRMKKADDGDIYVIKTLKLITPEEADTITEKQEKLRKQRAEKRKGKKETS